MSDIVHVAVGVVRNAEQKILIAKRHRTSHQGDRWEFPGGKVEPGESVLAALIREFEEEVALQIHDAAPFLLIEHDYGDKQVRLDIWQTRHFSGEAEGREGQEIRWVEVSDLANYTFPEANRMIVEKLMNG